MAEYDALAKLLGSDSVDDEPAKESEKDDDMVAEDSRTEVFSSAGKEAFYAIKDGDPKAFVEALRTMIGAA